MTYKNFKKLMLTTSFACLAAGAAHADTLLATDDGIIRDSLCVGNDCANAETFDADTIRMKENNTRLHFQDTSVGLFPTVDWRLIANDSTSGGNDYMAVQNASANRQIMVINDGARTNALYIADDSKIGMGTSMPTNDFHIKTGNNPSVRLEQDSSNGFIPQTWDFAGNGTLFFVRDVTNGNKLPFVVRAGAPNNAFGINSNGYVGVGTSTAAENLHVRGPGNQVARIESINNGNAVLQLQSGTQQRKILGRDAAGNVRSQILMYNSQVRITGPTTSDSDTYLVAGPGGISTRGPNCNPGPCDATFDPDEFTVPSIEDHAAYMWENQHLWAVGPTKPHEPFNITQKTGGILHELEVAHIYIEQLHDRLKSQEEKKVSLETRVAEQDERLAALEATIEALAAE